MKFGPVPLDEALGVVLAHSVAIGKSRLKKGRILDADDLQRLQEAGISQVIAARLEASDIGEDAAARRIADKLQAANIVAGTASTGRVNLYADCSGLFRVSKEHIDAFNRIDPSITLATLADYTQVNAGDMVATIKIIPLAVQARQLERAVAAIAIPQLMMVKGFRQSRVGLVATRLPSLKTSVMDKTARLLQERLNASDSQIVAERRVDHDEMAVGKAIVDLLAQCDLIIAFGASAIVDPADVLPAGILAAGGTVDQVGMPVDPGNLLVLGHIDDVPVIGAPGCARSPKENGFDWILARLLAGEVPKAEDIMHMGVGGLLKEIPGRPQPRLASEKVVVSDAPIEIVVLAAGRASRMGGPKTERSGTAPHKLLAEFDGIPLIRKSAQTALQSGLGQVHVITGYRKDEMEHALIGLDLNFVHNPDFEEGMASSLRCGVAAVGTQAAGVMVMLADMPGIGQNHLMRLVKAFRHAGGKAIVRAASGGVRGNPVLLPRETFDALSRLEGDVGARQVIASAGLPIIDVDIGDAALLDVDTQQAVIDAGGILKL